MQAPNQKSLHYKSKVNYRVLNELEARLDEMVLQLDELMRLFPGRVFQIKELEHSIYDFQVAAENERHRLFTKIQEEEIYARVQRQLQENEYAKQMLADAQDHKRCRCL